MLPLFPDDEVTYLLAAGKRIQLWRFIFPVILGNIAKTSTSYLGDEGTGGISMTIGTRVIVLVIGLIIIGIQEYWLLPRLTNKAVKINT